MARAKVKDISQEEIDFELFVDNFAGGGGASKGIEMATGRLVDIAINHDPIAIGMHKANHPHTIHLCESVWKVDPVEVCKGRRVGLAWFSPDCTHFSKAKGGKPVKKHIRGLAWVVVKWAKLKQPRIITLENVEEFEDWGPLVKKADGNYYPCPLRKGKTFKSFTNALRRCGYTVEWRVLRACDYGAPTIRKRLFLIARCDSQPIVWPEPTHGNPKSAAVRSGQLLPWRTAAECIDWSIPAPSIFERKRPLAEATLRRIAKGIMRYVVNNPEPFIVTYYGDKSGEFRGQSLSEPLRTQTTENRHGVVVPHLIHLTHQGSDRTSYIKEPFPTITAAHRGEMALVAPTLIQTGYGERKGQSPRVPGIDKPLGTVVAGGTKHAQVCAFLAKHYGGHETPGAALSDPISTITAKDHHHLVTANLVRNMGKSVGSGLDEPARTALQGAKDALVTSHLIKLKGTCKDGQPVTKPMPTVMAGGTHIGEVRAFLMKYYGTDQDPKLQEPLHTITTKDRFGLVTVQGEDYQIVDIGMRMLTPRELFRANGFPDAYIIAHDAAGHPITKTDQVAKCGNSVPPQLAMALVRANACTHTRKPDLQYV